MPEQKQSQDKSTEKESTMKDSFFDDIAYVARESVSPTADPKNDPVPGEEK